MEVASWADWSGSQDPETAKIVAEKVIKALDGYVGESSHVVTRSFAFVDDPELRTLVERDYKELSLVLLPGEHGKARL